jgi:hypothetical protein
MLAAKLEVEDLAVCPYVSLFVDLRNISWVEAKEIQQ